MRKKRSLLIAGLLAVSMMASGVVCAYADTAGAEGAAAENGGNPVCRARGGAADPL